MIVKEILKSILIFFHIDLTKNIKYDRLTTSILKRVLKPDSNCIDVGCHKGEILNLMIKCSPKGKHYAFEPIPYLFNDLELNFKNRVNIYPYALSDSTGETSFQLVKNAPAYSGIKKRRYDIEKPEIEEIKVELNTLDTIIPTDVEIHFIKIDVEGGEFGVMKGAKELLKRNRPIIIFECGLGASEFYNTNPLALYDFLTQDIGLNIYTLNSFLKGNKSLKANEFERNFKLNTEYYFVASGSELKS